MFCVEISGFNTRMNMRREKKKLNVFACVYRAKITKKFTSENQNDNKGIK